MNNPKIIRRLWYAALFSAVRSLAAAAGTGVIAVIAWWLQSH
jgi:hypothetical protein